MGQREEHKPRIYPQTLITQPLWGRKKCVDKMEMETYSTKTRGARRAWRPIQSRSAGFSIWSFRTLCKTRTNNTIKL